MKIALGPLQYYWSKDQVFQFYGNMADSSVDIFYLGETVCSRRHELRLEDWMDIANMLVNEGKKVVLSTQVLLETALDSRTMAKITDQENYLVEANDIGAVNRMQGRCFVAGPFVNIYNVPMLNLMHRQGAVRWVMPLEMSKESLAVLQAGRPEGMQTEVFVYGRMPLAFSARCFTARNRNLPKNNCQYVCMDHPDGLLLETQEKQPFLVINGIQTQSALVYNLISEVGTMRSMGVDVLRISPQANHTNHIVELFHQVINGYIDSDSAMCLMKNFMPADPCNGYWHGRPGLEQMVA